MKRWLAATALAVAGCQAASTATTGQELAANDLAEDPAAQDLAAQDLAAQDCYGVANFCGATFPPASSWLPGDPFPQGTANTVVLFWRGSAVWQVYGADPVLGKVLWRRTMKPAAVGAFMNLVGSMTNAYGGVRPPPPGVCPPTCIDEPALVLASALRHLPIQGQAEIDAAACPVK
jgi:hypothetical protein